MKRIENPREIERIEYRHGMIEQGMNRSSLPRIILSGKDIPDSIRQSIADEKLKRIHRVLAKMQMLEGEQ